MERGQLIVLSAPAGSGKSTVRQMLVDSDDSFVYSISATTRDIRESLGERDGVDYYFITRERFGQLLDAGDLLEYAEYSGDLYGTPRSCVEDNLNAGKNVILEIEVRGAMQVRQQFPEAVLVLLLAPSFAEQEARLRRRGTESEEKILRRLSAVRFELDHFDKYDYVVLNREGHARDAADDIRAIVRAAALKTSRNRSLHDTYFTN